VTILRELYLPQRGLIIHLMRLFKQLLLILWPVLASLFPLPVLSRSSLSRI